MFYHVNNQKRNRIHWGTVIGTSVASLGRHTTIHAVVAWRAFNCYVLVEDYATYLLPTLQRKRIDSFSSTSTVQTRALKPWKRTMHTTLAFVLEPAICTMIMVTQKDRFRRLCYNEKGVSKATTLGNIFKQLRFLWPKLDGLVWREVESTSGSMHSQKKTR